MLVEITSCIFMERVKLFKVSKEGIIFSNELLMLECIVRCQFFPSVKNKERNSLEVAVVCSSSIIAPLNGLSNPLQAPQEKQFKTTEM